MRTHHELPTGTVTLLFTDIEGSTRLVEQLRERYADVRADHERLLREVFDQHNGREIDTQGDAFFVVFGRAKDALEAAAAGQRALAAHTWPDGVKVSVRMGIHTGEPVVSEGRYTGMAVNRAARIAGAGHGGQILVSDATRNLVDEDELDGVRLRDLGAKRLKDMPRAERLHQVDVAGLRTDFPALTTLDTAAARARRFRLLLAGVALVVAAAGAAAGLFFARGDAVTLGPNAVGAIEPDQRKLAASIPVGVRPTEIAVGDGAVWVVNSGDRTVSRIDVASRELRGSVPLTTVTPSGLAVGAGAVWVTGSNGRLVVIDPAFNRVAETIQVRQMTGGLGTTAPVPDVVAVDRGTVWVAHATGFLSRIDARSRRVVATIDLGANASALTAGEGALWLAAPDLNAVLRIDPATNRHVDTIPVGSSPTAIAVGEGAVWVATTGSDAVSRVDLESHEETVIPVGDGPTGVSVGAGAVWAANNQSGTVSRIDPATREVTHVLGLGVAPERVVFGAGLLWVSAIAELERS